MERYIELDGKNIPYTLKLNNRSKRIRLAVFRGGELVASAPKNTSIENIEKFINRKSQWVINTINKQSRYPLPIKIKNTKAEIVQYKKQAQVLVEGKIKHFNEFYKFKFNNITIRNQKTRWGSCSRKGNLNFNYKIVLLAEEMADYIIVHELCHLGQFNHSQKFWDLVAQTIHNHKEIRRELKKSSFTLG